jgi:hypothetical protein
MVNIACKLNEYSYTKGSDSTHRKQASFQYRQRRSNPGGGLYRMMDDVRMVLQVHDELLFEVQPEDLPAVAGIVKECMEEAVILNVPLQVKLAVGKDWAHLQPFEVNSLSDSNVSHSNQSISSKNQCQDLNSSHHHFTRLHQQHHHHEIRKNLFGNDV